MDRWRKASELRDSPSESSACGKTSNAVAAHHLLAGWLHNVGYLSLSILWSCWWGGLTFYALVVVPIGTEVIGNVEQGFITQRVTGWHNALTATFVLAVVVNAYRRRNKALWGFAATLSLILIALVIWHARLTSTMDFRNQTVPATFYAQHAIYLWFTAAEWALGIIIPIWLFPVWFSGNASFPDAHLRKSFPTGGPQESHF